MPPLVRTTRCRNPIRLPAVDGLRGLLAMVVLTWHLTERMGLLWLGVASQAAVCSFFVLSGYVLTRSWDGKFGLFLARRFLRLWPVYALSLAAGYAIAGAHPSWLQFLWYPILSPDAKPVIDKPIWSLCIEAWAMLFMPLFLWASASALRAAFTAVFIVVAAIGYTKLFFGLFFVAGAYFSRWEFRSPFLESYLPQWLGRISYSLYLTHWLVFELAQRTLGIWGPVALLPLTFFIGWLVWRFVERPSIRYSRNLGSLFTSSLRHWASPTALPRS